MDKNFIKKISVLFFIVACFALAQGLRIFEIDGINPNLTLSALSAIAFVEIPFLAYVVTAVLGAFLLKTGPSLNIDFLAIMILAPLFWFFRKISPWRAGIGNLVFVPLGTVIFYAVIDYAFILNHAALLVREIVYNLLIVGALYSLFSYLYETEE